MWTVFLADHDLERNDIDTWIMHTGGPKVLEATAEALDLPPGALDVSWQRLRRVGNFRQHRCCWCWKKCMNRRRPAPGSIAFLLQWGRDSARSWSYYAGNMSDLREAEVLVAGGGPAGLAAAIAARQAGFEVAVVDCAQPPIDKACGEGIMPDGLAALAALGVQVDLRQAAPFRGIRFINGSAVRRGCVCRRGWLRYSADSVASVAG